MTLKYVGSREAATYGSEFRLAEFSYEEKEEERFYKIAEALKEDYGWKIDTGIAFWAAIVVEDRNEFEEVKRDFQHLRRVIK